MLSIPDNHYKTGTTRPISSKGWGYRGKGDVPHGRRQSHRGQTSPSRARSVHLTGRGRLPGGGSSTHSIREGFTPCSSGSDEEAGGEERVRGLRAQCCSSPSLQLKVQSLRGPLRLRRGTRALSRRALHDRLRNWCLACSSRVAPCEGGLQERSGPRGTCTALSGLMALPPPRAIYLAINHTVPCDTVLSAVLCINCSCVAVLFPAGLSALHKQRKLLLKGSPGDKHSTLYSKQFNMTL